MLVCHNLSEVYFFQNMKTRLISLLFAMINEIGGWLPFAAKVTLVTGFPQILFAMPNEKVIAVWSVDYVDDPIFFNSIHLMFFGCILDFHLYPGPQRARHVDSIGKG